MLVPIKWLKLYLVILLYYDNLATKTTILISYIISWITIGIEHILDFNGYDHILFLLALCCTYSLQNWKKLLIIISAFTIGHCFTLALSVSNTIKVNSNWIEFLIPITIVITCVFNMFNLFYKNNQKLSYLFVLTVCFGLIHGLGFSTLLKQMLSNDESFIGPLFLFNTGIELGQILIVLVAIFFQYILTNYFKIKQQNFIVGVSVIIFLTAMQMAANRGVTLFN